MPSTSDEHTKQKAPEEEVQEIDLCGAVSLPDVKDLLSEWIQSSGYYNSPVCQDFGSLIEDPLRVWHLMSSIFLF